MRFILPALGYLILLAALVRFLLAVVVGYRDGIVRQRIQSPFENGVYLEGVRARRYGWFSVIAGLFLVALILFALIPWHRLDLV